MPNENTEELSLDSEYFLFLVLRKQWRQQQIIDEKSLRNDQSYRLLLSNLPSLFYLLNHEKPPQLY